MDELWMNLPKKDYQKMIIFGITSISAWTRQTKILP